jgi:hypothetical protein
MKCEVKKNKTQIRVSNKQTGKRTVSCIEEAVIGMISDITVSGDPQISESAVNFSYTSNSSR